MILGEIPGLALDRTGIALLGAILLLASGRLTLDRAWSAIDVPTLALLLGLMVVSAQLRLGGFYAYITRRLAAARAAPESLLALLIAAVALLSALLVNDVICLAVAPVLVAGCARRRLNPVPFLLALACAANVGSAATLIGNPQNMLIGQVLKLNFLQYLLDAGAPALLGLVATWAVIVRQYRGRWERETPVSPVTASDLNPWQTGKGLTLVTLLVIAFMLSPWPRETLALGAAGVLLTSRKMATRDLLGRVDWQLLVLFIGLFVVNRALADSGMLARGMTALKAGGLDLSRPVTLFIVTAVLSNLVSNVPATMLLLPAATYPMAGPILALASTLAGNLLVVGSIANIIVVDQARLLGVEIGWKEHARTGVPVTVATLAIAAVWLWVRR
jgi:Na+/H+ antiporter NhaD/arsenite permease-like protein